MRVARRFDKAKKQIRGLSNSGGQYLRKPRIFNKKQPEGQKTLAGVQKIYKKTVISISPDMTPSQFVLKIHDAGPVMGKTALKPVAGRFAVIGLMAAISFVLAMWMLLPAYGNAPANDPFETPTVLSGLPVDLSGATNLAATFQTGENGPIPAAQSSVWFSWTAPATGYVEVDTAGSSFDTVLAVYTGDSLTSLTKLTHDDNGAGGVASKAGFEAFSGVTYRIAVYGLLSSSGSFNLHLNAAAGISGTVSAAQGGAPLPGIDVTVYRNAGTEQAPNWVPTGTRPTRADGSYVLGGFGPGAYRVGFEDFSGNHLGEFFNEKPDVVSADNVVVVAGVTTTGIDAGLTSAPRITGIVRGPANEPLEGIIVYLYQWQEVDEEWDWQTLFDTGSDGRYTCLLPAAGTYRIGFTDPAGIYKAEFHLNQSDVNAAGDIQAATSQTVSGIDAVLDLNTRITGTVTGPDGQTPLAGIHVTAYWRGADGNLGFWDAVDNAVSAADGGYSLINLPSGTHTYIVGFNDPNGQHEAEYYDDAATEGAATQIQVAENTVTDQIDASLAEVTIPSGPEIEIDDPNGQDLMPGGQFSFGSQEINTGSGLRSFIIRNAGTSDLGGIAVNVTGGDMPDFAVNPPAVTSLAAGESTEFTVSFSPSQTGQRSLVLQVVSDDADESSFEITLTGTGVTPPEPAPEIAVEQPAGAGLVDGAAEISFGIQQTGTTSAARTFTIRNTGNINLTGISVSGATAEFVLTSPPAASLAPGTSTSFAVTFSPAASGARNATLQIASDDADENPFDITLSGTGTVPPPPAPEIVVEQPENTILTDGSATIDFGSRQTGTTSAARTFTIRNTGNANLSGLALDITGVNAGDFAHGAPGATVLTPGQSTTFTVTFGPVANGARLAVLEITSNDADENPFEITLSGIGTAPPAPEIVVEQPESTNLTDGSSTIDFGSRQTGTTSAARTFTIRNTGNATLTGISVSGATSEFVLTSQPAGSLAANTSTTFTVTFSPSASGARSATLQIASDDADENPFDIALTGTGTVPPPPAPEIVVEQPESTILTDGSATIGFGSQQTGTTSAARTFTIRNTGDATLSGISVSGATTEFVLASEPANSLAPNTSTSFAVTFSPSASGARNATLQIASDDADENPFDIALTGTGTEPPPPGEAEIGVHHPSATPLVSGGAPLAFGTGLVNQAVLAKTFTVHNEGDAELTGLTATVTGGHAADFLVSSPAVTSLPHLTSTTFTVTFKPTAAGARAATLQIVSNDADENPFDVALSGTAVLATPDIALEQPAKSALVDGKTPRKFATVKVGRKGTAKTFIIKNTGTASLSGLAVTIKGKHSKDFVATKPGITMLAPGASTTFKVTFGPKAKGTRTAQIQVKSNDPNENPFDVTVSGKGS